MAAQKPGATDNGPLALQAFRLFRQFLPLKALGRSSSHTIIMKKFIAPLLALCFLVAACNHHSSGYKTPKKAHYKQSEGKKKLKKYNRMYNDAN
jgi:hypothetical protein